MSKAVLISIQPKWCELIAKGKKTLEVRKTSPKLKTPFKVYIYCTLPRKSGDSFLVGGKHSVQGNGKVIGEFVCDSIFVDETFGHNKTFYDMACMSVTDVAWYATQSPMYGWHISNFKIYDKPKELSDFRAKCRHYDDGLCGDCKYYDYANNESYRYEECAVDGLKLITRPPQSWCYVEEREENV